MNKLLMLIAIGSTTFLAADYSGCSSCRGDYNQPQRGYYNQPQRGYYNQPQRGYYNQPYQSHQQNRNEVNFQNSNENARRMNMPATANTKEENLNKEVENVVGSNWYSTGYENVSYEVNNGVVTLKGSVNSSEDKNKIEESVSNIDGVKQVRNQITVNR